MGPVGLSLGIAAISVVGLNLLTNKPLNRHPDAVGMAGAMLAVWAVSMWADAFLTPPESKFLNPPIDALLAAWTFGMWLTRREKWKLVVIGFLLIQSLAHLVYQTEALADGVLRRYVLILNVTYLGELGAIAWPGGSCAWNHYRERLRSLRRPHSAAGAI
jgi:hypothetical protein